MESLEDCLLRWKRRHEEILRDIRWDEQAEAYQRGCIGTLEDVLAELDERGGTED